MATVITASGTFDVPGFDPDAALLGAGHEEVRTERDIAVSKEQVKVTERLFDYCIAHNLPTRHSKAMAWLRQEIEDRRNIEALCCSHGEARKQAWIELEAAIRVWNILHSA